MNNPSLNMNEETTRLIYDLAEKLGTTADHLWTVLCRQAPISGSIGLLTKAMMVSLIIVGWKYLSRIEFNKWDDDIGKGFLYGGMAIATVIAVICAVTGVATDVSGLLNPEFWALKQILR